MNLYNLALFAHVSGAIGIFVGVGVWLFAVGALRQAQRVETLRPLTALISASSNLVVGSIAILGIAGFYMAITAWSGAATWIIVATVNFLLLAPLGLLLIDPRVRAIARAIRDMSDGPLPETLALRTQDPLLGTGLNVYITALVGIVFIMTTKPTTEIAILTAMVAATLGALVSLPLWRPRARRRATTSA